MDKQDLLARVKAEAKKLKKAITDEERQEIVGYISASDRTSCIYGKITGDCFGERAAELIRKCCERVYEGLSFSTLNGKPNKKNVFGSDRKGHFGNRFHYSPIEVALWRMNDDNRQLLASYLRGEIDTLDQLVLED